MKCSFAYCMITANIGTDGVISFDITCLLDSSKKIVISILVTFSDILGLSRDKTVFKLYDITGVPCKKHRLTTSHW